MSESARVAAAAWLSAAAAVSTLTPCAARADTLVVPDDFALIQAAIDAAEPADTVLVEPGSYRENLILRSAVDVVGRETARTFLRPEDDTLPTVAFAGVTGTRFSNFTLVDSTVGVSVTLSTGIDVASVVFDRVGDTGFLADSVSFVRVINNVFYRNDQAIVRGGSGVEVVNDIFSRNATTLLTTLPLVEPFANVRAGCFFANEDLSLNGIDTGVGAGATVGDPLFVDAPRDFHLREGSPCIDVGSGTDVIDGTVADAGVYGGAFADAFPYPVDKPDLVATAGRQGTSGIEVRWQPNGSYLVSNASNPGSYRVYYKLGGAPEDNVPSAYDGTQAGGGTEPSPIEAGDATMLTLEDLNSQPQPPPTAPRLREAAGRDEAVVLSWDEVPQATGYRVHYGTGDTSENSADTGNVTSYTVTGLTNGTAYVFAVGALNQAAFTIAVSVLDNTQYRHESDLSPPATIAAGEAVEGPLSAPLTATPVRIVPYPDLPDKSRCFIATAAFGADSAPVLVLRDFRDRFLSRHAAGRWLVRRYYALSPPAARFLDTHEYLKPAVRVALWPLVILALVMLEGSRTAGIALVLLVAAAIALRIRVRRCAAASCAVAALTLGLASTHVRADEQGSAPASPRWMYEIGGGYFHPDLDRYATFYGHARTTLVALSAAYRIRDWLEAGAEVGGLRDHGAGMVAGGTEPAGAVTYEVVPVQAFASFILDADGRRFVPYLSLGVATAFYHESIETQPSRDGRGDVGAFASAGLRWRFASRGASGRPRGGAFWRAYVFLEAQRFSSEVEGVDLGGTTYLTGVRVEFELGTGGT